ncbi:sulfite exporter TauE/SafE family protein [Lacibacterium aquatile]|uniref:Probable membrane transporter protein n=1 Tax=Lacibacterium aquatile TaxID=1168082 RepID=A0ABW5DYC1_9PROT
MTLFEIALLAGSGLVAGMINAIAGGGTFFTFSALVATGVPAIAANATSAVAVTPANITSTLAYLPEIRRDAGRFKTLIIVSVLGSLFGAWLLTRIENAQFRALVPWLILLATALFFASPYIKRFTSRHHTEATTQGPLRRFAGRIFQTVVAIYGGFFGAGMGIMMLAGLSLTEQENFHTLNALKNLLAMLIQITCIALFIFGGLIDWHACFLVMAGAIGGGWLGVKVGRKLPEKVIRWVVIGTGAMLTTVFFVRG